MSTTSFEKCNCYCHRFAEGVIKHLGPCCFICSYCGLRIRRDHFRPHQVECAELYKKERQTETDR